MEVLKSLFKAYDIRGIYEKELTNNLVHHIAKALSTIYKDSNDTIVVGRDGRLSSKELANSLISGFLESGKNVIDIGQVPTPLMYFAVNYLKLNSGIIITGSHNPKNYNGLKIIMDGYALAGDDIENIYYKILEGKFENFDSKDSKIDKISVDEKYIDFILKDIKIKKNLKVAVDAGNGVAGPIALKVYKKLGLDVVDLFCDVDGNFPNHHPNPSDPKNLADLALSVREKKCDLGIAFDGDGDRCLILDNLGEILWPDRQMMLYSKDILLKNKNSKIVYDVKSTKDLPRYIKKFDGVPIMSRTGHSYIKMKMREIGAILGGEMSGHIFFNDRWFGFDDGIYTGARMLELISNQIITSSKLFNELPSSFSSPEINIIVDKDGFQHEFMKKFINLAKFSDAEITTIDGLRADFKYGWGLVRASNTMPCLVMRFEADTKEKLSDIKNVFVEQILNVDSTLEIPNEKK